jgi:hypothetical protein
MGEKGSLLWWSACQVLGVWREKRARHGYLPRLCQRRIPRREGHRLSGSLSGLCPLLLYVCVCMCMCWCVLGVHTCVCSCVQMQVHVCACVGMHAKWPFLSIECVDMLPTLSLVVLIRCCCCVCCPP